MAANHQTSLAMLLLLVLPMLLLSSAVSWSQVVDAQDQVLLRYGYFDRQTGRVSCLEVSIATIESLPKVVGATNQMPLNLNLNAFLERARSWIESRVDRIIFLPIDDWLVFEARASDARDPFGPPGPLNGLEWRMRDLKITEIDIAQRRSTPFGTAAKLSGRVLIELTMDGRKSSGVVARTVHVYFLQDGTLIEPHVVEASKAESNRFRSESTESKSEKN